MTLLAKTEATVDEFYKVHEINSWDNKVRVVWYCISSGPKGRLFVNRSNTSAFPHIGSCIHREKSMPYNIYEVVDKSSIYIAPNGSIKKQYILRIHRKNKVCNFVVKAGVYQVVNPGDYVRTMSHASEHREFWGDIISGIFGHPYFWYLD